MPRGHEHISFAFSRDFRDIFSENKIVMGKKIQTRHKDLFFPLQSYSKKTLTKNVPKSARKDKRNVLMPPGDPKILLKSN